MIIGSEYLRAGNRARAGKVLREHADEYPPYRYELGLLHLQEQQWAEAATSLRHGFVDNPYIAEILCGNPAPMPLRIRVHAERQIEAPHPPSGVLPGLRRELEHLRNETVVWLRQFEPGSNSADANRLLDRLRAERPPGPPPSENDPFAGTESNISRSEKLALLNAAERERE